MNIVNRKTKEINLFESNWEANVPQSTSEQASINDLKFKIELYDAKLQKATAKIERNSEKNRTLRAALKEKTTENNKAKEISARLLELENERVQLSSISDSLRSGAALMGGATTAYLVYNNPAVLLDLQPVLEQLLPFALELAAAGAGIAAYALTYATSPIVIYPLMKFVQGIDSLVKTVLKYVFVTLPLNILSGLYDLAMVAYEHRFAIVMLAIMGVLGYYDPGTVTKLIGLAYKYSELLASAAANSPKLAALFGVGGMLVYNKLTENEVLKIKQLQVGNKMFDVNPEIFPSIPRGVTGEELQMEIANKVQRGHVLYNQILDGKRDSEEEPATLGEISDIMWFLQVKGEHKDGAFDAGAFNLPDTNGLLLEFLDSSKELYQRKSTHIKEMQKDAPHRGIDFVLSNYDPNKTDALKSYLENSLPYGLQTLMVAPMPANSGYMVKNRLLLKMETYGAWISPAHDSMNAPKSRGFKFDDVPQSIIHGLSLCKTQLKNKLSGNLNPEGSRKERLPVELVNQYNVIIQDLKDLGLLHYVAILEAKNPTSTSGGVRIMLENIQTLLEQDRGMVYSNQNEEQGVEAIKLKIANLDNYINTHPHWDHCEVRLGDEVVFNRVELKSL